MSRPTTAGPLEDVPATYPELWTCSHCGAVGRWAPGWRWWGSFTPRGRDNVNTVRCPTCPKPKEGPR